MHKIPDENLFNYLISGPKDPIKMSSKTALIESPAVSISFHVCSFLSLENDFLD